MAEKFQILRNELESKMDDEMKIDMLEEADNARKEAHESDFGPVTDQDPVTKLKEHLGELMMHNTNLLRENGLSMGNEMQVAFNHMRVQIRVLVQMLMEDEESMVMFEIACQKVIRGDLEQAVEVKKAEEARSKLTDGLDLGSGLDLSALRDKTQGMNRQGRRQAAREVAKLITKEDGGI